MYQILPIAIVALLSAMSPGPDFLVVSKYALCHSRQSALFCTLGIATGILFHATYCVLGLGLIISQSIVLFNIIKLLGAAYLIYIGLQSLRSKKQTAEIPAGSAIKKSQTHTKAFKEGLGVNVLNPKCCLFMLAVFTLVIDPHSSRWLQLGYGLEIALVASVWFGLLAFGISLHPIKSRFNRFQDWINKLTGIVLIAMGLKVAITR